MRETKLLGAFLAFCLSVLGVQAHGRKMLNSLFANLDGMKHQHHRRQDWSSEDTCACYEVTTTMWIPYVASEWTFSTVTEWVTNTVYVEVDPTATYTWTGGPEPTDL